MGRAEDGIDAMEREADALDAMPDNPDRAKRLAAYGARTQKFGAWLVTCSEKDFEKALCRMELSSKVEVANG